MESQETENQEGQDGQEPIVVPFTKEQFMYSDEPYAFLYKMQDNPFKQNQYLNVFEGVAKSFGIRNFRTLWKNYLKIVQADRQTIVHSNVTNFPDQHLVIDVQGGLKCGEYVCDENGISIADPFSGGEAIVCQHPIIPVKRIVNIDTGECKTAIAFQRGKTWKTEIFDNVTLANATKIVNLAAWGIAVDSENARRLVSYLSYIGNENYDSIPEEKSISRLGWVKGHGFSPYVKGLQFDGLEDYRQAFECVGQSGSEEAWMELVLKMRASGNVPARLMLAASFSSVLIDSMNALPFILHAWSNVSGVGKSVGMMVAASVWAMPEIGRYVKTFNSTMVGLEMIASFCGSLPVFMDELCLKDGKRETFDAMIYQYCEGVGRTRGSKTGGIQQTRIWKNCCIATGEYPITSDNSKAGAVNRVFEVSCGETPMFEDPRGVVRLVCENYGFAGKRYVDSLSKANLEIIRGIQEGFYTQLDGKTTDKQRLSASIILAADAWATMLLFKDDHALTVDEIVPFLQDVNAVDVNRRAMLYLLDTITANPGRFQQREDGSYQGECWGEIDENKNRVYLIRHTFEKLMDAEGYNSTGFLKWAKQNGYLITSGETNQRLTYKKRIQGLAMPARCICLRTDVDLDRDDEDEQPELPEMIPVDMDAPF